MVLAALGRDHKARRSPTSHLDEGSKVSNGFF